MKNILLLFITVTTFLSFSQSVENKTPCATDALLENLIKLYPETKRKLENFESNIVLNTNFNRFSSITPTPGSITIPIVVYIVHDGTTLTDISDNQVQNQITSLNNYFYNTGIKFCLATKANSGNSIPAVNTSDVQNTPGIIHINNSSISNHFTTAQQDLVSTASPLIVKERYLRIWVVKSINGSNSGILGYSMFPNMSPVFDGIVMRYDTFGNNDVNMLANHNLGKVLVHEVGHYLGLYHTFEGGCQINQGDCSLDGDRICDTPTVASPNFNCITGTNSCLENPPINDDISNYMDYGNNYCQDHFSLGQINRMINVMNLYRNLLFTNENILYTGVCGSSNLLSATFTIDNYSPCQSLTQATTFSALSATTYSWDFGDSFATSSNPNTANTQSPSHVYTSSANSPYLVTLTVTNSSGESRTSSQLIYVTNCVPIANKNSYWYVDSSHGLNFSSGSPLFDPTFPTNHFANLSCNSQCDDSGNLLFYTNKFKVWNNQHIQINTADIMEFTGTNISNQVLILPKPPASGNTITQYYIFTQQAATSQETDIGFRYNIVNVNGNAITMGLERQPVTLPDSYGFSKNVDGSLLGASCISAVKKCNSNDYWVITVLKKGDVPYLVVFTLSNLGLTYNSERLIQNNISFLFQSELEIAPNGNKILLNNPYSSPSHLYDFNKAEGIISSNYSIITIPTTPFPTYGQKDGVSFSPNSNFLYVSETAAKKIYQFNINAINVNETKREFYSSTLRPKDMQLGPDNKIYVGMYENIGMGLSNRLAVIHNPDNIVNIDNPNACNFSLNGPISVNNYYSVGPALPNIIDANQETAYFSPNTPFVISKYITGCNTFKFFPNVCGTSFIWRFTNTTSGTSQSTTEANPIYTFAQTGTYVVTLFDANNTLLGTSTPIEITVPIVSITGSNSACLSQTNANITYNSTILELGESIIWSINSGNGIINGPNNLPSVEVSWSSLPGTLTFTKVNSLGCFVIENKIIESYCPTLGSEDYTNHELILVPNPTSETFEIFSKSLNGEIQIDLIDLRGRVIKKIEINDFSERVIVDLKSYESGVYLVKIQGVNFNTTKRIIKK